MRTKNCQRVSARNSSMRRISTCALSTLLLLAIAHVAAASTYTVESYLYEVFGPPNTQRDIKDTGQTGATEASTSAQDDPPNQPPGQRLALNSFASGNLGAAHIEGDATFDRANPSGTDPNSFVQFDASAHTIITIDDLVITGPTAVSTKINFLVDGSVQAGSAPSGGSNGVSSQATFAANVFANNTEIGTGLYGITSGGGNIINQQASGWLANFTGNNVITTAAITLPVNTPITLRIDVSLLANAAMNSDNNGLAQSVANFGNTFSFATDRPVFNLPLGYTVNSPSGGIIANTFTPVPEPASFILAAFGFIALAARGWRRRKLSHT